MVNWEKIYTLSEYAPLQPLIQQAVLQIQQAQRIAITTHLSADGDAIGSQLALYWGLQGSRSFPVRLRTRPHHQI